MLMNKQKYLSMPDELREIIDRYSGDYSAVMAGIYWDSTRTWIYDNAESSAWRSTSPPRSCTPYSRATTSRRTSTSSIIVYLNGFGLDGQAIYDKCMEIVSRYTAEYADPWAESVTIDDFKG
jgi:hypothetical protein